jgi:hypothetical protein
MTVTSMVVVGVVIGGLAVIAVVLLVGLAYMHALLEEERVEHARTKRLLEGYQTAQESMARRQALLRPEPHPLSLGAPDVLEFDPAAVDSIIGGLESPAGPPAATRVDRRPEGRR